MEPSQAKPVTAPRALLGLFIVGQLIFLCASNILVILEESKEHLPEPWKAPVERLAPGFTKQEGHLWELTQTLSRSTKIWDHATGQAQQWSLFAPGVSSDCTFLAVELHWDEPSETVAEIGKSVYLLAAGTPLEAAALLNVALSKPMPRAPELWLSDNEPTEIDRYFRLGNFRFRKFENNLALDLAPDDKEAQEEIAERWRDKIDRYLKEEGYQILPYLKWRLRQIQAKFPDRPAPKQVILLMRYYRINEPGEGDRRWDGPYTNRVARWQPDAAWPAEFSPLEMYNPVTKQFEKVLK